MKKDGHKPSRHEILEKVLRGAGLLGLGGALWGGMAVKLKGAGKALRPPGSLSEEEFIKACIRCGSCVESCPYDTLKLASMEQETAIGTPFFEPRSVPCYMCPDVPCVPVCPSGALDIRRLGGKDSGEIAEQPDIRKARMGSAVIDEESCLAYWGIQCDACYRVCPLMGEAITLDFIRNDRTGKHAFLEPHVHKEVCTGYGLCEHACVTEKASIFILPVALASGEVGTHYIKGWDRNDEERIRDVDHRNSIDSSPEDHLNDWEKLLEEE